LFRAAGLFEADSDPSDKQPHEMTAEELASELAAHKARAEELARRKLEEDRSPSDPGGIMD
jgi:hypothetical protein